MVKGHHLLIDCYQVPRELCLDDQLLLKTLAQAAEAGGATVISQVRYRFGASSPPGCTAIVLLDESHCSVHTYADLGLMALDIFTCGETDTRRVWDYICRQLSLEHTSVREQLRFETLPVPDS
ncbi:MAG: adenosylmethionine decarboxylase [bacterium]